MKSFLKSAYVQLFLKFMRKMKKDSLDAFAAQSALFVIMSFFPTFMLLLALIQYTPFTSDMVMDTLLQMLPSGFYDVIDSIVKELFTSSTALVSGTAIAALWAASRSILAITNGLNSVRGVRESRNYFIVRLRCGIFILFLLISIVLDFGFMVVGNRMQEGILQYFPMLAKFTGLILSLRSVLSILVLSLMFLAMYCALPNCRVNIVRQIPGAIFAAAAWSVYSYGFSIYFDRAGRFTGVYGSLTTVVMMMLWLYFCMWLLFAGAEVNCYLEYPDSFETDDL